MGEVWNLIKLEDVAKVIDSLHKTPKYADRGFPMIRAQDIVGGSLNIKDTAKVSLDVFEEFSRNHTPKVGDLVYSRVGAHCGKVSYVNTDKAFCLGQNTVFIISQSVESKFLYYVLESPLIKQQINQHAVVSSYKTISLKTLRNLEVKLPCLQEQKAIASILSALDDKIELNLEMNKTLEEMAMALYKHWFVDFGPFQDGEFVDSELGKIPKGWEVKSLGDVASVGSSKRIFLKEYVPFGIPFFRGKEIIEMSKGKSITTELFISEERYNDIRTRFGVPKKDDILISSVGTIGASWLVDNNDSFYFKDGNLTWLKNYDDCVSGLYIFQWLNSAGGKAQIKAMTIGSTQKALTITALKSLKLVFPPTKSDVMNVFSEKIKLLRDQYVMNKEEIETLTKLRDTMLPKLISGEVRVKDIAQTIANTL